MGQTLNPEIKFLHFRAASMRATVAGPVVEVYARGGMTFAYIERNGRIEWTVAKCHANDNFNKNAGRVKAGFRLDSEAYTETFTGDEKAFTEFASQVAIGYGYVRKFNGKRKRAAKTEHVQV